MALFHVMAIKDFHTESIQVEAGMHVHLFCLYPDPRFCDGLYIKKAFKRTYGIELSGSDWINHEYLEIRELDSSKSEHIDLELELLKAEKEDGLHAEFYEELALIRNREKVMLEKLKGLPLDN